MAISDSRARAQGGPDPAGWKGLFHTAFNRSDNAMVLVDERRRQVDVNRAFARLLSYNRDELVDRPIYDFVCGGPRVSNREWAEALSRESTGSVSLRCSNGSPLLVQYAAHPENVTGQRFLLFVALNISRSGAHFRRDTTKRRREGPLSRRELEVLELVALGSSGPEIADELHISHNTVRTHVRNAMVKIGARSRAQLVAMALAEGHVPRE